MIFSEKISVWILTSISKWIPLIPRCEWFLIRIAADPNNHIKQHASKRCVDRELFIISARKTLAMSHCVTICCEGTGRSMPGLSGGVLGGVWNGKNPGRTEGDYRAEHSRMPYEEVSGAGRWEKMRRGVWHLAAAMVALGTRNADAGRTASGADSRIFRRDSGISATGQSPKTRTRVARPSRTAAVDAGRRFL